MGTDCMVTDSKNRRVKPVAGRILVLAAAWVWGLACSPPPDPGMDPMQRVLFDDPILLAPGARWDIHSPQGEDESWRFHTLADLFCLSQGEQTEPLRIDLIPEKSTSEFYFRAIWDDADIELHRAGRFWIDVPPDLLAEGRHRLRLVRLYPPGVDRMSAQHDNFFTELSYTQGDRSVTWKPADGPRLRRIGRFVQHGVIGHTQERRGGLLGVAAGRHLLPVDRAGDGTTTHLRFEPENFSGATAVFSLTAGDRGATTRLDPEDRGSLAVQLDPGVSEVTLEVQGQPDGLFLWGLPILDPPAMDPPAAALSADLPPVILITLDTTRRDALSPYSGRADVTPVIERLAEHATVYDNAFSTAPWTLPSHASIFTGLYPSRHGAGVTEPQLPPEHVTLAELLRRRGYLTAGFSAGDLSSSRFGLAQGFHHYRNPDRFETQGGRIADYVNIFLTRYAAHPLFLFINYFDAHALYQAPDRFDERFEVGTRGEKIRHLPFWGDIVDGHVAAWRAAVEGEAPITPEVIEYLEAAYLAEVAFVDELLGRLFDQLRDLGLYDRALIVVTSDHGELLGEGGYVHHASRLDPELVEIPLIIKWPGQKQGERVSDLVSLVDLFPTVLSAAGIEPPPSDGRLLTLGSPDPHHAFVLFEEHFALVHPLHQHMRVADHLFGVQRPGFRQLVWYAGDECARQEDGEWRPEPCITERERVLQSILSRLQVQNLGAAPAAPMSDELRETLEALGYL